jgi:hypothetical protein
VMKKLWGFLKHHVHEDFDRNYYFSMALLLVTVVGINYTFDVEDSYLDSLTGITKFLGFFLLYSVPYFLAVALYAVHKKENFFESKEFLVKAFFGLAILSLDSSVPFLQPIIEKTLPSELRYWAYKVSINLISYATVFFPIIIFYKLTEKVNRDVYGLQPRQFDARPYFMMLLIMLPLIITASRTGAFVRQYPMYKSSAAHTYLDISETVTVAGYELAYGLDFITVEFLFRGFMVIAMMTVLGRGAVLTMAVLYCTLHFGKPMGEAVSSVFGGYILGVVAYETRSIWGGVIVHIGIAWMMEIIAFAQKSLQ